MLRFNTSQLLCIIACSVFTCPLSQPLAASDTPSQYQYTRTVWRVSNGLPEDTVQALAESSGGFLWIGTTGGLAEFDGLRIKMYEPGRIPVSSVNSIFCLSVAHNGDLWAGTEGGGLVRITPSGVRSYTAADGLRDGFVRSILEDDRGRIWVGTDGGLFYKDGDRFRQWISSLGPFAVHSITQDNQHRLWVGGSRLFAIDAAGNERDFVLPGAYSQNRVKRILQTEDGTIWVGTVGGLQRLRNGRFEVLPGIRATVRALLQTSDGTLWIGTIGDGLWTLPPNSGLASRPIRAGSPAMLPSETILSILEDDQRQVWIGTQAGLVRLDRTPVSIVALPEGGDPDYETISGDARGNLWVAAARLYSIHDGVARPVSYIPSLQFGVRNVFRARNGDLWIGTDGGGAYRIREGGGTTHYAAPAELTNNFVRAFHESRDGTIWIACDEGVALVRPDGIQKLTEANGLVYFSTRSLLEDSRGGMWIGTDRGLSHRVKGNFVQDAATHALANEKVWSILEDRRGGLWFGTRDHGLFYESAGSIQHFSIAEGLPTNSIYQLLQDRAGRFWITGPNSITSVRGEVLEAVVGGASATLTATVYDMPFGGEGAQLYGGRQPAGYLAPDDTVWFPTNRGAAHVRAVEFQRGPGPRAYIEEVLEDGRVASFQSGVLDVPARTGRLSIVFSAAYLRSQAGLKLRYKLDGFDKGWNIAGASREAVYTNLPAGNYRFVVTAYDAAAPDEVSQAVLSLRKQPFFFQTWWFYTASVLLLTAIGWSLYQIRLRQVRARFRDVLQERSRLAREMHDTVIQGCTGISALLEAMAITPDADSKARDELLQYAREQARATVSEARQVVWDMRHEQESEVDLVDALHNLCIQNQREGGAVITFRSQVEKLPLTSSIAHEILMTAREAITNALQHSGATRIEVGLEEGEVDIVLTATDHGCGFTPNGHGGQQDHYGIVGMRERAQRIGAQLVIASATGYGTRIELTVPRAAKLRKAAQV